MRLNIIGILVLQTTFLIGCSHKTKFSGCNDKKACINTVFDYKTFNQYPIKEYGVLNSPFQIENGKMVRIDSAFSKTETELVHLFSGKTLLPLSNSNAELVDYNVEAMQKFNYKGNNGQHDTGICCLDVVSLYKFSFREKNYVALYCLPFGENYFPSENFYDEILILYKIKNGKEFDIIISTKQGSFDLYSFGDFSSNGKLSFLKGTNETEESTIYSYELDESTGRFKRTNKFLKITYDNTGQKLVNCSESCWY